MPESESESELEQVYRAMASEKPAEFSGGLIFMKRKQRSFRWAVALSDEFPN